MTTILPFPPNTLFSLPKHGTYMKSLLRAKFFPSKMPGSSDRPAAAGSADNATVTSNAQRRPAAQDSVSVDTLTSMSACSCTPAQVANTTSSTVSDATQQAQAQEVEAEEAHEVPLLAPTTTYEQATSSTQLNSPNRHHNDSREHGHHYGHHHHDNIEAAGHDYASDSDEFSLTEGYETRSNGSTSATSSIYAHTYEHGRRYQSYKNSRYPIPNDDAELSREDMKHAMLLELLDGQISFAPLGKSPQNILDIGTGTGIWAIDAGDRWPMARVRGMDISPVQPLWVPPNVDFLVDDCEQEWLMSGELDYAHFRFMAIVLKDLPVVLGHAMEALKPGGWIEFQELNCEVFCDDETMSDDDPVKVLYDLTQQAFDKFNMNITMPKILRRYLADAGFVNIQCVVKKVPIGVWAKDKTLRLVGMYQKMAILEIMEALAGRPFDALGLDPVQKEMILMEARKGLDNPRVHRYFNYYFWFAQKPQ